MNSYQRRLQNIEFLRQRGDQLEAIIIELATQVCELGHEPHMIVGLPISGDNFLNDISSGDLALRVISEAHRRAGK